MSIRSRSKIVLAVVVLCFNYSSYAAPVLSAFVRADAVAPDENSIERAVSSSDSNFISDVAVTLAVSATADGQVTNSLVKGTGNGSALAFADFGVLKVRASGSGVGVGGGGGVAQASFEDSFRIDAGSLNGSLATIRTRISYNWNLSTTSDVTFHANGVGALLQMSGYSRFSAYENYQSTSGLPFYQSYLGFGQNDGSFDYQPLQFDFEISAPIVLGTNLDFSILMLAIARAGGGFEGDPNNLNGAIYTGSTADANGYNSMYWGGISVFDDSGNELSEYSLISESGVDWRRSYIPVIQNSVSEPGILYLTGIGLLLTAMLAVRRRVVWIQN